MLKTNLAKVRNPSFHSTICCDGKYQMLNLTEQLLGEMSLGSSREEKGQEFLFEDQLKRIPSGQGPCLRSWVSEE